MKVCIEKSVFEKFSPDFIVGVLFCSKLDNRTQEMDIPEMLRDIEEFVRITFSPENARKSSLLSAWKAAHEHFGDQFKHYHTNVERLMLDVLDGKEIPRKDKLADLCNFMSLKHIVPIGAFDASKIQGDISFRVAEGKELFGKQAVMAGELVLCDDTSILARKLHYEAEGRYGITKKTQHAIVLIEALPPVDSVQLLNIVEELAVLIKIFCGGTVQKGVLNKDQLEIPFS